MKIIESRNKREGGYVGKWYTGYPCGKVRKAHRRANPYGDLATLREIARNLRPF